VYGKTETEVLGKLSAVRMQSGNVLDFEQKKSTLMAYPAWWLQKRGEAEPGSQHRA